MTPERYRELSAHCQAAKEYMTGPKPGERIMAALVCLDLLTKFFGQRMTLTGRPGTALTFHLHLVTFDGREFSEQSGSLPDTFVRMGERVLAEETVNRLHETIIRDYHEGDAL